MTEATSKTKHSDKTEAWFNDRISTDQWFKDDTDGLDGHIFSQEWNIAFDKTIEDLAWLIRQADREYALARAKERLDQLVREEGQQ